MWNNLFFLNEADDDEEKKKNDDDKKDKDNEKKEESKDDNKKEKDESDDYNDLELDLSKDDDEISSSDDDISDDSDDYNDLDLMNSDDSDIDDDIESSSDDSSDDDYNALLVVNKSDSDSGDGASVYEKAVNTAYAYTVIANNMKHIHLTVCGDKFEEIHRLCEEYYYHFTNLADFYYELAAESPLITIKNSTRAKEHCSDIAVEMEKEYDFKSALQAILANLESAIKYVSELRNNSSRRTDVQSKADDELGYLNKQSRYFVRRRLSSIIDDTSDISPDDSVVPKLEAYKYYYNMLF